MGNINELPEDKTQAILARHIDQHFITYPMAEGRSNISHIQQLEETLKIKLPLDYVAHLLGDFPGLYLEVKEQYWPRPKIYDTGPFWSFLYALHTFTASPDSENWMRIEYVATEFQTQTNFRAIPILRIVGDADLYCIDTNSQIVQFSHETNELIPVNMSFFQLLEREVTNLQDRLTQKLSLGQ